MAQLEQKYGIKTIASVVAASAIYRITFIGTETIAGHNDYHLSLKPLADPHRYRLRDVWIDTASYVTDKIHIDGNFVDGGTSSVPWTITFRSFDGAQFIDNEVTDAPIRHWFDAVSVSFENYSIGAGAEYVRPGVGSPIREPRVPR